jgi:tetrahydromethanopterin S-methyltransferase subunit C
MSLSFAVTCLWFITANLIGMLPSRDHHWTAAYGLIAVGVPLLGWLTLEHGPVAGIIALAMGASVLRWPLIYLMRRLRNLGRHPQEPAE